MKFDALPFGKLVEVELRPQQRDLRLTGRVYLSYDRPSNTIFVEASEGTLHPTTATETERTAALSLAEPGAATITVVSDSGPGKLQLSGRLFPSAVRIETPLRIGIPPEIEEKIPRKFRGHLDQWLAEEFACEGTYFAQAGREKVADQRPFELLGEIWGLGVEVTGEGLVATKLRRHKNRRPAILLVAAITLVSSATTPVAAALQGTAEAARQGSPWLSVWRAYQDAEKEVVIGLHQKFGRIAYKEWRYVADGRRILFDLGAALPDVWLEEEQPVDLAVVGDKEVPLGRFVGGKARHPGGRIDQVEVEVEEEVPPEAGFLAVALEGTRRRLQRRDRALEHVLNGTGQLPDLGEILVGHGRSSRVGAGLRPETARTQRALKGRSLNADQRRAIEVALNSPDIALIQGPPGTGKTTVIRLITERLHEEGRSPILLTSFQHEAVLRVLEGVSTAGIPGIRVGGKRGEDPAQSLRPLTDWLREVATQINTTLAGLDRQTPWTVLRSQVDSTVRAWRRAPGGAVGTRALIQSLQSKLNTVLDHQEQALLEHALSSLEQKEVPVLPELLRQELAKLRQQQATTQTAWKDAGPANCKRLGRSLQRDAATLERLGYRPSPELQARLQQGQAFKPFVEAPPDFLEAWSQALEELDELLQPPPPPPDPAEVPVEAERALQKLLAALDARVLREPEGLADVLARFLHRMETDPLALPDILSRYAHAFGATVQQAVGKDMQDFYADFDTVIVDEAARANPLDLLVALVLGRRLILVGDQNQLPHMLEPRLEAAVLNGQAAEASAVLAESLFSRLWNLYKDCPPGGFSRTQMLSEQYRMHPQIGYFVSENFYQGQLKSRTNPIVLTNDTPIFDGKNLCFVDVAKDRESGRYIRRSEAALLADRVDALLRETVQRGWTIGVIAFYRQQVALLETLKQERAWGDRVQVGTVDAFQGREFDAVFLSCVRSNKNGSVGFLALSNRLNVAMSRARRVLAVFGDSATIHKVPALKNYIEAAKKEGYHDCA